MSIFIISWLFHFLHHNPLISISVYLLLCIHLSLYVVPLSSLPFSLDNFSNFLELDFIFCLMKISDLRQNSEGDDDDVCSTCFWISLHIIFEYLWMFYSIYIERANISNCSIYCANFLWRQICFHRWIRWYFKCVVRKIDRHRCTRHARACLYYVLQCIVGAPLNNN